MSVKALSDYTFYSRYAQYLPEEKRRETWDEAVTRVFDMHRKKYADKISDNHELGKLIEWAETMQKKKRVLAAQRTLQFAIDPILKHEMKNYNCTATHINRERVFAEMMYVLLCGCGAGFSVQKHHVKQLGNIKPISLLSEEKDFVIDDSIEGWAEAVGVLMDSYFENPVMFPEYNDKKVKFHFHKIRPEGSLIAGRFKAPGPEGLKNGLEKIEKLINRRIQSEGFKNDEFAGKLRPIDAYDIIMHISDCVLSGGVRRCLPIGSKVFMKNGVKNIENVKRGDLVLTPTGYEKVLNNFNQGEQETIEILTQDGTFECTPNHKMAVLTSLTEYKWVRAEELQANDRLITNMTPLEGQTTHLPTYSYVKPKKSTTCKDIVIPQLDTEIAWLLGHIAGDGYIYYNPSRNKTDNTGSSGISIVTNKKDLSIAEKAKEQLERFGVTVCLKKRKNENSYIVSATSQQLAEYFYNNFKKPNTEIEIPECIWNAPNNIKIAYVSGLMDADGAANNKPVIVCQSVYENFIKNIQTLLYSCGISTRLSKLDTTQWKSRLGWQQLYTLSLINTTDKNNFLKENDTIVKDIKIGKISRMTNNYPSSFIIESGKFDNKTQMGVYSSDSISVDRANEYGFSRSLNPVKVIDIQRGRKVQTFDIEVENAHQFFCNGYLTHNSATLCMFSHDDTEMMNAKTGGWFIENPQRGRSNNSATLLKGKVTRQEFADLMKSTKQYGEPGFIWVDNSEIVFNPCVEISLHPVTEDGKSGWQGCNLTEINGKYCDTEEKFLEACEASAIIGTLQAGYTDFKFLESVSKEIFDREALLGCSITGWMDNPDILFDKKIQRKGAEKVREINKKVAEMIGINAGARTTCVKPAGSTSCVLGTASGIHPHHARRYIRRTQVNRTEFCGKMFEEKNPLAVEKSVWSANGTDNVISFLCEVPQGAITKNQMSAVDLLEKVKLTQNNWVEYGTNEKLCTLSPLRHNVSNTISVRDEEWPDVEKFIFDNQEHFAGISLLPASGDLDYPQAPFSTVLTPNELVREYGDASVFASGLIVDGLAAFDDNLWNACDVVVGNADQPEEVKEVPKYPTANTAKAVAEFYNQKQKYDDWFAKVDWVRRAKQFADRYFDGNIKKATHCLKHVSLWKTWCDLKREYVDIDWTNIEEEDQTYVNADTMASTACVGTKGCDI